MSLCANGGQRSVVVHKTYFYTFPDFVCEWQTLYKNYMKTRQKRKCSLQVSRVEETESSNECSGSTSDSKEHCTFDVYRSQRCHHFLVACQQLIRPGSHSIGHQPQYVVVSGNQQARHSPVVWSNPSMTKQHASDGFCIFRNGHIIKGALNWDATVCVYNLAVRLRWLEHAYRPSIRSRSLLGSFLDFLE